MFKRVERKRKRREEEEDLGLDEDMKEIMGLNDTDSDESDDSDGGDIHEDSSDQEEDTTSDDERVDEEPISVAEVLKDPIHLISLNPTVYGCVLCKGKLIKNAGMAAAHKSANAHIRRFEHFRVFSADTDPLCNAWELVRSISSVSSTRSAESQNLSKRALKRQVKQAAMREKRKRHKDLKTKAMTKKALKKLSATDETKNDVPPSIDPKRSPASKIQSEKPGKRQKLDSRISTTRIMETPDATAKSASRTRISNDSKKSAPESRHKDRRKSSRSR